MSAGYIKQNHHVHPSIVLLGNFVIESKSLRQLWPGDLHLLHKSPPFLAIYTACARHWHEECLFADEVLNAL